MLFHSYFLENPFLFSDFLKINTYLFSMVIESVKRGNRKLIRQTGALSPDNRSLSIKFMMKVDVGSQVRTGYIYFLIFRLNLQKIITTSIQYFSTIQDQKVGTPSLYIWIHSKQNQNPLPPIKSDKRGSGIHTCHVPVVNPG